MNKTSFRFRSILGMAAVTALCVSCAQGSIRTDQDLVRPSETNVPVSGRSETKGGDVVGHEEAVALLDSMGDKEKGKEAGDDEADASSPKSKAEMERALASVNTNGPENGVKAGDPAEQEEVQSDAKDESSPAGQRVAVNSTSVVASGSNGQTMDDSTVEPERSSDGLTASNEESAPVQTSALVASNNTTKKALEVETPAPRRVYHHAHRHPQIVESTPTPDVSLETHSKEGVLLNRFYFTRRGDTPEKVSLLIYGDKGKVGDLIQWNSDQKNWAPGTILYYSSPIHPEDKQMLPFFQERNIAPKEYTVRHGDGLLGIAHGFYGSRQSWKEIAIMNGLKGSDDIRIGQVLSMYPSHFEMPKAVVSQETQPVSPENEKTKPVEKKTTLVADAPVSVPTPGNVTTESPKDLVDTKVTAPVGSKGPADAIAEVNGPNPIANDKPTHLASLEIAKSVESSSSLGMIFAVTAVALLAIFLARRSRRRRRPDFFG
jgi:nucleoid-associated protein YgaU